MARLDTTVSDQQNEAVAQMAKEFGMSKSEIVSDAISVLMQAFMESKRGLRLMMVDQSQKRAAVAITTRVLTSMDWTRHTQQIDLSPEAVETVQEMIDSPAEPTDALREAMALRRPVR